MSQHHHPQRTLRLTRLRLVAGTAVAAVGALTMVGCGSKATTTKTAPGQSPPPTTAKSSGGYGC